MKRRFHWWKIVAYESGRLGPDGKVGSFRPQTISSPSRFAHKTFPAPWSLPTSRFVPTRYISLYKTCTCMHKTLPKLEDQDSLLVKRRNDNHSPGPVIRELVPSSHQRSELRNTILGGKTTWGETSWSETVFVSSLLTYSFSARSQACCFLS